MTAFDQIIELAAMMPAPAQEKKKHNLLAGAAIAAAGIPLLKSSGRFAASSLRQSGGALLRKAGLPLAAGKVAQHGKQVFDYIDGAQQALNKGINGKIAGRILRSNSKIARDLVPDKIAQAHYSSFRAGHKEAFTSMLEEVGARYTSKSKAAMSVSKKVERASGNKSDSFMEQMGHALTHLDELTAKHGFNEREALKHITNHPDHQPLMRKLALKTDWAPAYAKVTGGLAAVPLAAGAGVAATTRKDKK